MRLDLGDLFPGGCFPQPDRAIGAPRSQDRSVRAEQDVIDVLPRRIQRQARLAAAHIPQPDGIVAARCRQGMPIRAKCQASHGVGFMLLVTPDSTARPSPVATSHRRTVPSCPPEASTLPSGLKETAETEPSWPRKTVCSSPSLTSHNRTVP